MHDWYCYSIHECSLCHIINSSFEKTKGSAAQWAEPVSLTFISVLWKLYTEPFIGAYYQISVHLATWFQRRRFLRNWQISNKNCLWWPYRGPTIDASYEVSVHLAKRLQSRRFFRNQRIRNKNCLWRPRLSTDRDKMNILSRGTYIDASYQVSVHLAMQFQRRRFFRNQPIRNKNCLWQLCLLTDWDKMNIFIEHLT